MKKFYDPKTGRITSETPAPKTKGCMVYNPRYEPESYIEWADVERVGMAIRSAKGGSTQSLFALYRDIVLTDGHIQSELGKRKLSVIGDVMRVIPYDKNDANDLAAAEFCERQIYEMKGWKMALSNLLDGVIWPVSVSEKHFEPASAGFRLNQVCQVPYYLLDYSTGKLRIKNVGEDGEPSSDCHDPEEGRYIIHRGHLLSMPDHFGGPMRALIYWWLASTMSRDWWVRYLERYGIPFMVGKFTAGANEDRNILLAAMNQATRTFGIAISRDTEMELLEATKTGADVFGAFMSVAQKEKSKLIVGQTLSSTADATGMGSGVADLQGDVREDIRKFDGTMLAETIRDQLLVQLCEINRLPGRAPYIVFGKASNAEVDATTKALAAATAAGLEPDDDALEPISETIGFTLRRSTQPRVPGMFQQS